MLQIYLLYKTRQTVYPQASRARTQTRGSSTLEEETFQTNDFALKYMKGEFSPSVWVREKRKFSILSLFKIFIDGSAVRQPYRMRRGRSTRDESCKKKCRSYSNAWMCNQKSHYSVRSLDGFLKVSRSNYCQYFCKWVSKFSNEEGRKFSKIDSTRYEERASIMERWVYLRTNPMILSVLVLKIMRFRKRLTPITKNIDTLILSVDDADWRLKLFIDLFTLWVFSFTSRINKCHCVRSSICTV